MNIPNDNSDNIPSEDLSLKFPIARPHIPRRDLREPAFRKYEHLIARVINSLKEGESFTHDTGTQSADTFIARLCDAKRGFFLYNYPSQVLSPQQSLSCVRLRVISTYCVELRKETPRDELAKQMVQEFGEKDKVKHMSELDHFLTPSIELVKYLDVLNSPYLYSYSKNSWPFIIVKYDSDSELNELEELVAKCDNVLLYKWDEENTLIKLEKGFCMIRAV